MAQDFPDFVDGVLLVDGSVVPVPAPDFPDWTDGVIVVTSAVPATADYPDWTKVVADVAAVSPPTLPTGLDAWYDATQLTGVADGGNVTVWPDESGNGHGLTVVVTNTPTYARYGIGNLPSIAVVTGGIAESAAHATPTAGTCAGVFQVASGTQGIVGTNTNVWELALTGGNWTMEWLAGGTAHTIASPAVNPAGPHSFVLQWDQVGATAALWVDGALKAVSSSYVPSGSFTAVYQLMQASFYGTMTGQLGEVLIYPSVLSAGDVGSVHAYLADKWGCP